MLKRKNSSNSDELQQLPKKIKTTKIIEPIINCDILENILKYSMLIVEKTNKIVPPSSVTFTFKNESYSSKWFIDDDEMDDDEDDCFIYRKNFVRNISYLLNLLLVNKHFYRFLFDNLFRL